ncbi:Hypothetical predicted protein, partial [Paramuricea clavata]
IGDFVFIYYLHVFGGYKRYISISKRVMIFPAIYVSVTLFLIPSLYGDDDDLCKIAFEDEGLLDDAFDCNTTSLTNLTKES